MEKGTRKMIVTTTLAGLALISAVSSAADGGAPIVVVHLADLAGIGGGGLARTKAHVEMIFAAAGIRLVWADVKEGPNARACEGLSVSVALLSPQQTQEQGGRKSALGRAALADAQAWIYPERVGMLAWKKSMDERALLGLVIAHELGHLLLPGPEHSSDGIMTKGIDTDPRAMRARFSPQESLAIRARLESKSGNPEVPAVCGN